METTPGSGMTRANPTHARTSSPPAVAAARDKTQPPSTAIVKAALTSEEEQLSLALELSKLDMATDDEQIAHALNLSLRDMKERDMKEFIPNLQDGGFIWPCDEEKENIAKIMTPSENSNNTSTSSSRSSSSTDGRAIPTELRAPLVQK